MAGVTPEIRPTGFYYNHAALRLEGGLPKQYNNPLEALNKLIKLAERFTESQDGDWGTWVYRPEYKTGTLYVLFGPESDGIAAVTMRGHNLYEAQAFWIDRENLQRGIIINNSPRNNGKKVGLLYKEAQKEILRLEIIGDMEEWFGLVSLPDEDDEYYTVGYNNNRFDVFLNGERIKNLLLDKTLHNVQSTGL